MLMIPYQSHELYIDCSTKSGTGGMCLVATLFCSNTDIVKIDCGASSADYEECRHSNFS